MILHKQPNPAGQSAQYCVAMITNRDPYVVLNSMGDNLTSDTRDIIGYLDLFGFNTSGKLEPFADFPGEQITAILKVKLENRKSHWVVFDQFAVLDPAGIVCGLEEYQERIGKAKITSFLKIWKRH